MKIRKILSVALIALALAIANAEDSTPTVNIGIDMRADFDAQCPEFEEDGEKSTGIYGRYFNLKVNGTINDQLSYSWRQRLNKYKEAENDVFAATDWIYLTYQPTKNWAFSAGKQVLLCGGFEYDAAPIDVFISCRFWNNFACYQFGGSTTYITDDGNHQFTAQVTNSPYQPLGKSCYSYNLFWSGNMGWYQALWSANLIEYAKGKYANFLAFGNRLSFGPFSLELDLMNRATSQHKYWFYDYSLIGKAEYQATPWMTLMAKGGNDDWRMTPGDIEHHDKPFYGGGFFFFPWHGSRDIRIHALADVYHDNDGCKFAEINVGLTWRVNLYTKK